MTDVFEHQEQHAHVGGLLKEAVFGFNDGVVSTFAVVAGLTGGLIENKTVLLGALATLIAGAFSMGLGTYIGSKSEKDMYENEKKREEFEMKNMPDREREEIREIYRKRGFSGALLEQVVEKIAGNPRVWLQVMMVEELGFAEKPPHPIKNGITMSIAFTIGSFIPALPYIFQHTGKSSVNDFVFQLSLGMSIVGLILIGIFKTKFTGKKMAVSAFETLLIGAVAAAGSYAIGLVLA